jgi:hypothetical protein
MATVTRKQLVNVLPLQAAHMGIARVVVTNVVPEHCSRAGQDAVDFAGDILGHVWIQNRAEYGKDEEQIKVVVGKGELFTIRTVKIYVWVFLLGGLNPIRKQIGAIEVFGGGPQG